MINMDFIVFLSLQLIAHLLVDYFFQNDKLSQKKNQQGFYTSYLFYHSLIVLISSWLLSFEIVFFLGSAVIGFTHYLIDGIKSIVQNKIVKNKEKSSKKSPFKDLTYSFFDKYTFYLDQFLHLTIIFVVVKFYFLYVFNGNYGNLNIELFISNYNIILYLSGILLCLKPSNILIGEILKTFKIEFSNADDLENAGKLIGNVERILVLTFIILEQYEAVGFLIAAKSILRYNQKEPKKTECVLIGTMISFAIAIFTGLIILKIK